MTKSIETKIFCKARQKLLLAFSPNYPAFYFAFAVHFTIGASMLYTSLQLTLLYPRHSTFLIGLANSLTSLSSMWPQIWFKLIQINLIDFSSLMFIWSALSFLSLMLGLFIYPWHNLSIAEKCDTLQQTRSKGNLLLTTGDKFPTLWQKMQRSITYVRTPMFFLQFFHLPIMHVVGKGYLSQRFYEDLLLFVEIIPILSLRYNELSCRYY